jgi:hypothetical protein
MNQDLLYTFGAIGGILYIVITFIRVMMIIVKSYRDVNSKYKKYERFYNQHKKDDDSVSTIGFKTKAQQEEIEMRLKSRN